MGYNARAAVSRDQIIPAAEVMREESDQHRILPMKETVESNLTCTGKQNEVNAYLRDAGYCKEAALVEIRRGHGIRRSIFMEKSAPTTFIGKRRTKKADWRGTSGRLKPAK